VQPPNGRIWVIVFSALSNHTGAVIATEFSVAAARKSMDVMEAAGEAAVRLIAEAGGSAPRAVPGKGGLVNTVA
jgi:hypothetical protein